LKTILELHPKGSTLWKFPNDFQFRAVEQTLPVLPFHFGKRRANVFEAIQLIAGLFPDFSDGIEAECKPRIFIDPPFGLFQAVFIDEPI
jgi:hypothetical protein